MITKWSENRACTVIVRFCDCQITSYAKWLFLLALRPEGEGGSIDPFYLTEPTVAMGWVVWIVCPNITKCNDNFLITKEFAWRSSSVDHYKTKLFRRGSSGDGIGQGQIHKVEAFRRMYRCGVKINNLHTRLKLFIDHFDLSETRSQHMWTTTRKPSWGDLASLPNPIIIGQLSSYLIWYIIYSIVYII